MKATNVEIILSVDELRAILKLLGNTSKNDRLKLGLNADEDELLTNTYNAIAPKFFEP